MKFVLACKLTEEDGYVQQMEYSPIIGGYTLVLSSGKALFVIPPSIKVENSVSDATGVLKDQMPPIFYYFLFDLISPMWRFSTL